MTSPSKFSVLDQAKNAYETQKYPTFDQLSQYLGEFGRTRDEKSLDGQCAGRGSISAIIEGQIALGPIIK